MIYSAQRFISNTSTGHDDKGWLHPGEYGHLVSDVKAGDLADLLVKVFGLAARDPMEYCRTIKAKMKLNKPTVKNFDLVAHQWILDQYDQFATINEADCIGEYKMAPTDFVDHIIDILEVFIPTFTRPYRDSVTNGETWNPDTLKTRLEKLTARGQLKVEDEVRATLTANKVHAEPTRSAKLTNRRPMESTTTRPTTTTTMRSGNSGR
jgi:hypothetical protein